MKSYILCFLIILLLIALTACYGGNVMGYQVKETKVISKHIDGIETIKVYNGVGEISCKPSNDNEIKVTYTIRVSGNDKNSAREISDRISISLLGNGQVLEINALYQNDKELWKWKTDNYKGDISINYTIEIPNSIKNVVAETGVGSISLKGIEACFIIKTGVGEIKTRDIVPALKSNFETGTGGIDAKFLGIENAEEIYVNSSLGDVKLSIPKHSKYKIDAIANNRKCDFPSDQTSKTIIIARAGLGNIKLSEY